MLSVLLGLLVFHSASAQCSYNKGDVSANWHVSNGMLSVQFMNKNIRNNQWTGMGWGPDMTSLEVVVFKVTNNGLSAIKGFTTSPAPPMTNPNSPISDPNIIYSGNMLTASFTRPLAANGPNTKDLTQCMSWKFVAGGDVQNGQLTIHNRGTDSMQVCPQKCT